MILITQRTKNTKGTKRSKRGAAAVNPPTMLRRRRPESEPLVILVSLVRLVIPSGFAALEMPEVEAA